MAHGVFVTGTDTGVGKTLVCCALLRAYARAGYAAVGMKPVASGCEAGADDTDVALLRRASGVRAPAELVNPYAFRPAIAPHAAAAEAGVEIDLDRVLSAYDALAAVAQVVVVEGVGGFRVPLNDREDTADLAQRLALPVVLVVGMRLGCLNHALLTLEAVAARGLTLAGWVANRVEPDMAGFALSLEWLRQRIDAPLLGTLGHRAWPDADEMAKELTLPAGISI